MYPKMSYKTIFTMSSIQSIRKTLRTCLLNYGIEDVTV